MNAVIDQPPPASAGTTLHLVLGGLLLGDALFVGIHLLWLMHPGVDSLLYSLGQDRSYAEFYLYMKLLWGGALLAWTGFRHRSLTCLAWTPLFLYLLLDDAAMLHERFGQLLDERISLPQIGGMGGEHLGEALYAAGVAALLLIPIGITTWLGKAYWREMSLWLLAGFLALGGFAIGLDSLDEIFPVLDFELLSLAENAGEMICVSVMLWVGLRYACSVPLKWRPRKDPLRQSAA